jgi:FkbM family methyltransferase
MLVGMRINAARIRNATTRALIRFGGFRFSPVVHKCRKLGAVLENEGKYLSLRRGNHVMWLAHEHFIYAPYLSSNFETFFSPLVSEEINGRQVVDFSAPGLQTYAKSGLQFEMASFPEEEEAIEGYFRTTRPKGTIFDIGAHCGVSTYHFSKMASRVIAFEPDPLNYSLLLRNIERHSLTNVTALQIAISGTSGTEEFSCEGTIGSSLARHASHPPIGKSVTVETVTLQDAFERWGNPQFCKIDIEGGEIEVIAAAKDLLKSHACEFALDTGHRVDGEFTDRRIEQLFRECGYRAVTSVTSNGRTTTARPKSVTLAPSDAGIDVVCDRCGVEIMTFPNARAAYSNTGVIAKHVCHLAATVHAVPSQ